MASSDISKCGVHFNVYTTKTNIIEPNNDLNKMAKQ